jgi:branched-subunit amino acid ABC-type transport system permease component
VRGQLAEGRRLQPGAGLQRLDDAASIVSYGLAVGAVYALIGITYNVMFSASRVFSFTAGMLGMLGGVLGALFIHKMGMNAVLAFVLVLAAAPCSASSPRS